VGLRRPCGALSLLENVERWVVKPPIGCAAHEHGDISGTADSLLFKSNKQSNVPCFILKPKLGNFDALIS
jgi:hypothetical protein